MSRTNETRFIEWHENKLKKKRRGCKELIDKGICDKRFIWNPSNCECERDKTCDIAEYLDYKNCKWRKKLADKLIDECTETIEEVKLAKITLAENENNYRYSSCTVYIALMIVLFTIFTGITAYFVDYNCFLIKNNVSCIKSSTHKEKKIVESWMQLTYKWEKLNKLILKIELILFTMIKLI